MEIDEASHSVEVHKEAISADHNCDINDVKYLCIFDLSRKFKYPGEYDIGGCYSPEPELWFYFKTTMGPGYNFLLSLYMCHRKPGNLTISISNSNQLKKCPGEDATRFYVELSPKLKTYTFASAAPNVCHHIKTFCFTEKEIKFIDKGIVFIPLQIQLGNSVAADPEFVKQIKVAHDFGHLLETKKGADLVLESASGLRYDCHKTILAAQSSVLMKLTKDVPSGSPVSLDIEDEDLGVILKLIYTGMVKDLVKKDCYKLLKLAKKYDISTLFEVCQHGISKQIEVRNAVSIALLSEEFNLTDLQKQVFDFINRNPEVLQTEAWQQLQDVRLTKKILQHIHSMQHERDHAYF